MKILFNKQFLKHNEQSEMEGAYRLSDCSDLKDVSAEGEKYISLVHDDDYIEAIKDACIKGGYLAEVQLNKDTWKAACLAVGLTVMASEQNDFAAVRPPGHHAGSRKAEGFCFFNNIAIATQHLVNSGKRVFIFDFDAHHGNGTQRIFYDTDKVLFSSIHQIFTYPWSGYTEETGKDAGAGYTINMPLTPGSGDKEYFKAFEKILDKAREFNPDVVGVSAGFDGYSKDKLMNLDYSLKLFYETGFKLRRSFSNIFAVLEGGYHNAIRLCIDKFIEGVNIGALPPKIKWDHGMAIG